MLVELRAENYAVIDHAIAVFGPGLNLLTGETGAGKSILVDALALLMGGKASVDIVRHGADRAVVSCVSRLRRSLTAFSTKTASIRRALRSSCAAKFMATGKGRVFVNNQPATVTVLRLLAPELALVHAQSETLSSFDQAQQRILLDRFANLDSSAVVEAHAKWRTAAQKLLDLEQGEQDRLRMVDLWSYQRKEIDEAQLKAGEDDDLENEKRVLANAEKLFTAASSAFDQLYEGSNSAESALRNALRNLEELAKYDAKFADSVVQLTSARAIVDDIADTLRDYAENIGVSASPDRLVEIEDRLVTLDRLKRKYGSTTAEVIAFGQGVAEKLSEVEDRDEILKQLRVELDSARNLYSAAARALNQKRQAAASVLAQLAENQINDLAMRVRFEVTVSAQLAESNWGAHGWDEVQYKIATNPGEPLKPLDEIASGGEMSRVMLALKVTVEEGTERPTAQPVKTKSKRIISPRTLVFDEIDIGIGGRAAEAVGQKLKKLSEAQQVLCVTHLPQIAAFADQHFLIEKREDGGRTKTQVRLLDDKSRVVEVARMLSGAKVTEASQQHASQMIAASR